MKCFKLFVFLLICVGCRTTVPKIDVQTWAGDSEHAGITRSQENKTIECKDPKMDEFVCVSYEDLKKIYETFFLCKQWTGDTMSSLDKKAFYKTNQQVLDRVVEPKHQ